MSGPAPATLSVAFQGELGAYSHEALARAFGDEVIPLPCREFEGVGAAVGDGTAELGLLPIENSLAGSVVPSYDVLAGGDLTIVADLVLPIHHCLLGTPGARLEEIRRILSHPVALAQCTGFLRSMEADAVAVYDTAGAARTVADSGDRRLAAIAGRGAARRYGLEIMAADIEDRPDNQTRFVVVARRGGRLPDRFSSTGPFRSMLVIETENRPGALLSVLEPFARHALNLSKIESRPGPEPWTYRFFLEVEANGDAMSGVQEELRQEALTVEPLGSYPRLSTG